MSRTCRILRVFTRDGGGGNHLGVVTDLSDLGEDDMQSIATGLGFSETVFLDARPVSASSSNRAETVAVRIFTPARELPFAGHPLVGAASEILVGRRDRGTVECGAGPVGIRRDGEAYWIDPPFDQPVLDLDVDPSPWAHFLRGHTVEMPVPYHVLEFASPFDVADLRVPEPPLTEILAWSWVDPDHTVAARFFAPGVGVPEDPATGSAAVALARVLQSGGKESGSVKILQGDEIGFPSLIDLEWERNRVSVGGTVSHDGEVTVQP